MDSKLHNPLEALERTGLIRLMGEAVDPEYQFRHALTHQAAYASLTRQMRRWLHRAIGQTLESMYAERTSDYADLLAHHFALAGDAEPAAQYALRAAEQAVATFAYDEAVAYLERALTAVGPQGPPSLHLSLLESLGDVHALLRKASQALGFYRRALDSWQSLPAPPRADAIRLHRKVVQVSAETKWSIEKGDFESLRRDSEFSRQSLEAGLKLLEGEPPYPETVRLLTVLSTAAWRMQSPPDWGTALRHAQASVSMAELLELPEDLTAALGVLSSAYFAHGQLRLSLETALRRLDIARRPGFSDVRELLDSLRGAGSALMYVGDYDEAIPLLLEAERLAARIQAVDQEFSSLALLTQCWFRLDRWEDLLAREDQWEEMGRKVPQERTGPLCFPLALRAVVHARRGDSAGAEALRDRSMQIMVNTWGRSNWLRNAHY